MKKPIWYLYHFQTKAGKIVHTEISVKLKQWQKDNIINRLKAEHNEETIICKLIGIQS